MRLDRFQRKNDRVISSGGKASFGRGLSGLAAAVAVVGAGVGAAMAESEADRYALPARGIVRPVDQATISTDLQARVSAVAVKEGAHFKAGDVLVEFDCRRHKAELAAVVAQRREAELALDNNLVLNQHRAIGKHEVEIAKVRVDKASGEADALKARVDDCRIVAPFDGRVAELGIHAFETPSPGKPFISIINDRELEIELIVPSDWLGWLRKDAVFEFTIDELKRAIPARVSDVGAAVDPVSQTIKIKAQFAAGADISGVLSGMSGAAEFSPGKG